MRFLSLEPNRGHFLDPERWASRVLFTSAFLLGMIAADPVLAVTEPTESIEFFEKRIRPVLAKQCYSCHGPDQQLSDLRVDSRQSLLKGGKRGSAILPGNPEQSLLISAVRHDDLQMPPTSKLTDTQIQALAEWIQVGAPWPANLSPDSVENEPPGSTHWAFQAVRSLPIPAGRSGAWSRNPVDRFLVETLQEAGLEPAPAADRPTQIRRLSFVLTGLPPTLPEVEEFTQPASSTAYQELVDRLLDSPHFGEQWARHWMDVVRFSETHGYEWNYEIPGAWRYRDYLIRAFNQDVPFDQLIREHIAGDLLQNPRIHSEEELNESLIGAAFLRLGEMGHDSCTLFRELRTDVVDDQIDTLTKAFQGLTVACARCHDHKLDPIPTEDYYALYGVLNSSRQVTRSLDTGQSQLPIKPKLQALKPQIRKEAATAWIRECDQVAAYLLAAQGAWEGQPANTGLDPERVRTWLQTLTREAAEPESPLYLWNNILCASRSDQDFQAAWRRTRARFYQELDRKRIFNRENFTSFADFRAGFAGWHPEGLGFPEGAVKTGDFAVQREGPSVLSELFSAGVYSHVLSDRLNGALRSPHLPKDYKFLSLRLLGGKLSSQRTIVDNCSLGDRYKILDNRAPHWRPLPTFHDQALPVYVELLTKQHNPRFPERPDMMKDFTPQDLQQPGSFFGILEAVLHDVKDPPWEDLSYLERIFAFPAPATGAELAARYASACREALTAWLEDRSEDADVKWINWLLRNHLLTNSVDLSSPLKKLVEQYRTLESSLSEARVIDAWADLDPGHDYPVLKGGDARSLGDPTPRGYLQVLSGDKSNFQSTGSGRLELAEQIASPANPLTARVMVNRIWHHVFGRGLVASVDDLGRFGDPPSHPELLDFLAARFTEQDWSIKKLVRLLVLSQAFRQANTISAQALTIDPDNRLLHHYPVRRLTAESIRDAILATSGQLKRTLYGPSIPPFREFPKDYRKLHSGPLDGDGRRSIYLQVTRMEGARFLELFDFPIPSVARGHRDVTNVPSQALALLNDPFILQQAQRWADHLVSQSSSSGQDRINRMFRIALSRPPTAGEIGRFQSLAAQLASWKAVAPEQLLQSREIWKEIAHAILNLKEFPLHPVRLPSGNAGSRCPDGSACWQDHR